jgi:hypothetical protein
MDRNVTDAIESDKNQLGIQLMMARRAVSQLLNTWSIYSDYETKKFSIMKSTDEDYIKTMLGRVESANTTTRSSLMETSRRVSNLNNDVLRGLIGYIDERENIHSGIEQYRGAVGVLNQTTGISIDQVRESAFNLDANDDFVDKKDRNKLLNTVRDFENDIDKKSQLVLNSVAR